MYCFIPKAACTTWKRTLVRSLVNDSTTVRGVHKDEKMEEYGLRRLNAFRKEEIHKILASYYKFMVVRHPFERLVSAYRNKFEDKTHVKPHFHVEDIIAQDHGTEVTFSKFVKYLMAIYGWTKPLFTGLPKKKFHVPKNISGNILFYLNQGLEEIDSQVYLRKGSKYINSHFAQFSTLCHPCHIHYDHVIKLETMTEDAKSVLSKLGQTDQNPEEKYPELFRKSQTSSRVTAKYLDVLTTSQIETLKEMYSIDFKLFGFDPEINAS